MRLLGMTNYVAKFCLNYSTITAPIRALLQKDNAFCWRDDVEGVAFEKLKQMLATAPCLAYFDKSKRYPDLGRQLQYRPRLCDASEWQARDLL